jgi:hypothetical protein
VRSVGRNGVDANGVVAVGAQHGDVPAERAAANFDNMCRGSGEMAAYERPSGGNPSVAGCHSAILRLRVAFLGAKSGRFCALSSQRSRFTQSGLTSTAMI